MKTTMQYHKNKGSTTGKGSLRHVKNSCWIFALEHYSGQMTNIDRISLCISLSSCRQIVCY